MSSFVRTIQRTLKISPDDGEKSERSHYAGRGSKLGVINLMDPCRPAGNHKAVKPWRDPRKVDLAARKACMPRVAVPQPLAPKPTRDERRTAHRARMAVKHWRCR